VQPVGSYRWRAAGSLKWDGWTWVLTSLWCGQSVATAPPLFPLANSPAARARPIMRELELVNRYTLSTSPYGHVGTDWSSRKERASRQEESRTNLSRSAWSSLEIAAEPSRAGFKIPHRPHPDQSFRRDKRQDQTHRFTLKIDDNR